MLTGPHVFVTHPLKTSLHAEGRWSLRLSGISSECADEGLVSSVSSCHLQVAGIKVLFFLLTRSQIASYSNWE